MIDIQFNDSLAARQVIGSLLYNNELLGSDQYPLNNDYFNDRLDVICYASIYNVYNKGIRDIKTTHIIEFLTPFSDQLNYFLENNGEDYLTNAKINAQFINYDYYYNRLKKMYMLKTFDMYGFNIKELYNTDETNEAILNNNIAKFDSMTCDEISVFFEKRLSNIQDIFSGTNYNQGIHAGHDLMKLYNSFKEAPEMGLGLNGNILNTIVRGARLKKLICRSAPSGVGDSTSHLFKIV